MKIFETKSALKLVAGVACATFAILGSANQSYAVPSGYTLSWSDEFNGAVGSAPNSANWGYDTGAGGWGNNELETYTTSTTNSRIISDGGGTDGLVLQI